MSSNSNNAKRMKFAIQQKMNNSKMGLDLLFAKQHSHVKFVNASSNESLNKSTTNMSLEDAIEEEESTHYSNDAFHPNGLSKQY